MKLAALCSGGKDSLYALWSVLEEGHEVKRIIVMMPRRRDSWMFHQPDSRFIEFLDEAIGLPLTKVETEGTKREELLNLKSSLENLSIEGVVYGAIRSAYQKERIEDICESLDLTPISPLWKKDPFNLLQNMIEDDFIIIVTSVSAGGLGREWLGRKVDKECLEDLRKLHEKYGIHPTGEGGEYETAVLDAPFMSRRIKPVSTKKVWQGDRGYLEIEKMKLVNK
ncbi:hypothetical protein AKJ64_02775 [candidate division MSBL1 archaeon SCGC-AAA259E17]|uniref:Diphthamide synthase domain-containing protein n=1 Tax=candidate division MSBL1 archaeon SCGC-AAA259E17 TaxID=1698263 RepID=A0A133UEK4_9EURY|nr:hypothetical protein AKJ64_02775 [candidate division MSBL1 archaeon SCGC-AAA259E17]